MAEPRTDKEVRHATADLPATQRVVKQGSWHFDLATSAVWWAGELFRLFDVDPTASAGLYDSLLQRVHPDDRARVLQTNAQARAHGRPFAVEYRILTRNGEVKRIYEVGWTETDEKGQVVGLFGTAQDITECQQADAALRDSEERCAGIVNLALDAIITADHDHRIVVFNPSAERIFGCAAETVIGTPLDRFIPPRYSHVHHAHMEAFARDGRSSRPMNGPAEITAVRADGQEFPIEASISILHRASGPLYTVILRDITERKQAEAALQQLNASLEQQVTARTAALRESEERLRLAHQAARMGTFEWNLQTGGKIWTAELEALYGLKPGSFAGTQAAWEQFIHPEDRLQATACVTRSLETDEPADCEFRVVWQDGTMRWLLGRWQMFRDNDGTPRRLTGVNIDITDRKKAEEELKHSHARLRALATQLNLAEQRERQRLAAELHDHLQQILVIGKIRLHQAKRHAGDMLECAADLITKAEDLLSDALDYTRTLVADLNPRVLREHGLVAGLHCLAESLRKRNQVVTVVAREPAEIRLSEDQMALLYQSVRELLMNAWKYAGTAQATVTLEQGDDALRIVVRDEGCGFDPATAIAAAETPSGGLSSKFGLFSIQERMNALNGRFDLESAPNQGTTVTLIVPVSQHTPESSAIHSHSFAQQ